MIGCFNKSVLLTYFGIAFSLFGIYNLLMTADYGFVSHVDVAVICLILAGVCDLFDGAVARKCKRNELQKNFGIQIDTLADVISFLVFPSVLLYFLWQEMNAIFFFVIVFYILCGINRLAWFNIHTEEFQNFYRGLPVTYAALIIPCLYVCVRPPFLKWIFPIMYGLLGIFFILNIKLPKPRGVFYPIFGILAVVLIFFILF